MLNDIFSEYRSFVIGLLAPPPEEYDVLEVLCEDILLFKPELEGKERLLLERLRHQASACTNYIADLQVDHRIAHCALGILGELAEIHLESNTNEELGDLLFYLIALTELMNVPIPDILEGLPPENTEEGSIHLLCQTCEELANRIKKVIFYKQELGKHYGQIVNLTILCIQRIAHITPIIPLIDSNTGKLTKRYDSGFSTKASEERKDKECED